MEIDFTKFENEKRNLLIALAEDPQRFAGIFYVERSSGFLNSRKETFSSYLTFNQPQLCCIVNQTCKNNIITVGSGKEGDVSLMTLPDSRRFVIKTREVSSLSLTYSKIPPSPVFGANVNISCLTRNLDNQSFLGCDDFTNELLIGFIIDSIYNTSGGTSSGLKGFARHYAATICNNNDKKYGLNIISYSDLGDINQFIGLGPVEKYKEMKDFNLGVEGIIRQNVLTVTTILDIFKQLIANLHFIIFKADYTHSDLKSGNVTLKTEKTNINYNGMTHTSDFTVKIIDFGRSSIRVKLDEKSSLRVYNRNILAETLLNVVPFKPQIDSYFNEPYYIINNVANFVTLSQIRNTGFSFYSSFDIYTVFVSLFCLPGIFYQLFTSPTLKSATFDLMFFPDDLTTIYSRIYSTVKNRIQPGYDRILTILDGIKLKCRLTSILFDALKLVKS